MAKYSGKDEKINGKWYPVTVKANTLKEAINKLYVGQQKSYGTVQAIRGRFSKEDQNVIRQVRGFSYLPIRVCQIELKQPANGP